MARTKLYLKQPKSDKETPIVLSFSFDGQRVRLSTGERIHPSHWNERTQQVSKSFKGSVEINANLDKRVRTINEIYHKAKFEKTPTKQFIKDKYNTAISSDDRADDFWIYVEQFIEKSKLTKSKSTILNYKDTVRRLKDFEQKRRSKITIASIDGKFYDDFCKYFIHTLQLSNNSVGKYIKVLKTFLNHIAKRTHDPDLAFRIKHFKALSEPSDTVYLTEDEIESLYQLNLSEYPALVKTRDIFVLQCYIGLRVGDLMKLDKNHIKGELIHIRTKKTNKPVVIPIHPKVKGILEKYNGKIPIISKARYNTKIKEVARLAKIDEPVEQTRTKGGIRDTKTLPKYQMISSHTARRSFASNTYKAGISPIALMMITGHTTEQNFLKYIRVGKEENAKRLLEHDFFKAKN